MFKKGFTLAEVLITLAIIGVVAALTIPSVVANTQQQEFKTGLKKAVSVLNSAITMNMAIDGESPYDNGSMYHYLGRHMSVMKTDIATQRDSRDITNASFYTTDGMRFEFPSRNAASGKLFLRENSTIFLRGNHLDWNVLDDSTGKIDNKAFVKCSRTDNCAFCGSYGLANNPDNTTSAPCLIVVDVNGDRKPFPKVPDCWAFNAECHTKNVRKFSDPNGRKLTDSFSIMITDKQAIPFGTAAQKAMYEAQK